MFFYIFYILLERGTLFVRLADLGGSVEVFSEALERLGGLEATQRPRGTLEASRRLGGLQATWRPRDDLEASRRLGGLGPAGGWRQAGGWRLEGGSGWNAIGGWKN